MKKLIIVLAVLSVTLAGCKDTGRTLPSATGTIYEMLVVVDKPLWEGSTGDTIRHYLAADMPCMPQMEPYFNISHVSPQLFDDLFKPTRNILYIDINPERYTQNKVVYSTNIYSQPQAVCRLQIANAEELPAFLGKYGENIRQWFVRQELDRQQYFYRSFTNKEAREAVQKRFTVDMLVPSDYMLVRDTTFVLQNRPIKLVWCVNDGGSMRKDLLVWAYPYTDNNTFTEPYLLAMRDSIMRHTVSGAIEGSYCGTEYKQIPPQFNEISVQKNAYAAEIRGLWKMFNGTSMGGPFVQHTRLDEINQQVVTAEVFLFAPGQKKRNALRQQEAILYSLILQQEINELKEINVTE